MAAYSAVAIFRQTLQQLLDSDNVPLDFPKPQIESLHRYVCSLQASLDQIAVVPRRWRGKMRELEKNIRDAIYLAQDKVEYLIKGSSPERYEEITFNKLEEVIAAVAEDVKRAAEEINQEPQAENLFSENYEPAKFDYSGWDKIVGQKKDFRLIKEWLELDEKKLLLIPITGIPGIGKTTLARSIYNAQSVRTLFNIRAWVTVSQEYNYQEILSKLLNTLESKQYQAGHYAMQGDERALHNRLQQELYNQKYLIVIDDIWETDVWERIERALPDKENGSRIIFTTRQQDVAEFMKKSSNLLHKMQPLNRDKSWKLLCYKTFTYEVCQPHRKDIDKVCPNLKDTGRKIAENCKGLPLSIVVVGGLLSQEKDSEEYWKRVEEDTTYAASIADDSYLEILSLSYNCLPGKLKGCFLYMAAFPEDTDIPVSKLIKLWIAEGFLPTPAYGQDWEAVAQDSLEQLARKNLISIRQKSSNGGIKFCGMENSLWELAKRESIIEKFIHSRIKFEEALYENWEMQRRVSFHRNILICLEEIFDRTQYIEHARSLLFVGPHHHHPLPFCLTFDLLRVLDAFTLYFVDFPNEFLELIHLTYLSLTYNHEIPHEISNLQKLQVLMVRRQPKIIYVGVSFLPDEIWEMPNLRHLWFTETDFPPLPVKVPENRALLLNLQTLANVNAVFFTDEILENMPNVKKLSMWIERPEAILFDLTKLSKLEFFKFVVLNPVHKKGIVVEKGKFLVKTLTRLHLSGTGLPWDYMKYAAENMENLEVLKLKEMAFNGEMWSLDYDLKKLKYLLIEYLEFSTWEASNSNFPSLQQLIVRHCYKLENIPEYFQFIRPLELMEMVDCSPSSVESLEDLKEKSDNYQVNIFSSWE